ncbi:AraC family transcriptional regulator [Yoonia sp. BS5-3]|uniref:AraC family transcriptional regulator n=1 Tax=Yoonia phaeophyticola TaxID=3137369 RepID=A0ABZ2V4L9_9RHOB
MAAHDRPFVRYEERLNRVLCYIYENLDEELSLDRLSDIACMSRYHWHRVFRAMTDETLSNAVRRLRLLKAANALVEGDAPVRTVAEQVGYKNLASFSRAFKLAHGVSPNEFRAQGTQINNFLKVNPIGDDIYPITVKDLKGVQAAGVPHIGPYRKIGGAFKTLGGALMANSLMDNVGELFVIYHDPPEARPESELRSHVAISTLPGFPDQLNGLEYFDVVGGKYAVLEHKGPYPTLKAAYEWLYGHWLPGSGLEPRHAPALEVYIDDPKTTPSIDLRTEIRLPLV